MSLLGNRVMRTEDPRFLRGAASYVADLDLPGSVHAVFVRSVMAHAEIAGIDPAAAAAMPGVLAVVTATELGELRLSPYLPTDPVAGQPLLAVDRVRFVGEPVAAVVAETLAQALDAAELVVVDYEPLPVAADVERALADEAVLFEPIGTNVVHRTDPTPATIDLSACDVVIDHEVVNQRMAAAPIEPRVAAVDWTGDRLVMWSSCQGAGPVKAALTTIYGIEADEVRVVVPDVGGGFGAKGLPHAEEVALAGLSRLAGRPVRWVDTRSENLVSMVHGRGQRQRVRMGGRRDGTITHYALHVDQDCGAYVNIAAVLPSLTMMMQPGPYAIADVQFSSRAVVTNTTPVGAFRGAGRPEATAAVERAVDLFAAEAGIDPAEVRRRNLLPAFTEPRANAMGVRYDIGDYPAALERVLAAASYDELREEQARRRATGDRAALGIGLASYVEITAIGRDDGISEFASLELLDDGTILALTGSTPHGQGHVTTWAMVVADQLGVPLERVEVAFGDSDLIPSMNVTGGSRSAQIAGSAMRDAAVKLVEEARKAAAHLLEAGEPDVVFDVERGAFHVVGTPAVTVGWEQLAASTPATLAATSDFVQPSSSFPFGAHLAVVEVDLDTGAVRLARHVAVDDCGTILNPLLADGQVHGGVAAGAAQALLEEVVHDRDGTPLTSNFADYGVISAAELPSFERVEMVTPTPLNPIGAKGIGESGTIGATPAIHNAVVDAVAHLGVRHIDMPCTPERVWRAVADASP